MNEQIQHLAERALQLVADEHMKGDVSRLNTDSYVVQDLIQQKFAELIVQKCVSICNTVQADYRRARKATSDFDEKVIYAEGETASDTIKHKINDLFK